MMSFASPEVLLLLIPVVLGWYVFARVQKRALGWLEGNVSERFRAYFTVHSGRSMKWHLGLLLGLGLLLLLAAARPVRWGETEVVSEGGRILLLIDASSSMWAEDVATMWRTERDPPAHRLELASRIAAELVGALEGYEFALASYSGSSAIHLPAVADRRVVLDALSNLEMHSNYRGTGSSLASALDVVPHFIDPEDPFLQVVILGDGELPRDEDYGQALEVLARGEVPVHSVVVGSLAGQGRIIYDMRDVTAGLEREDWRVLREFTTRRVDEHLERISRRTGGSFVAAEETPPDVLLGELVAGVDSRRGEARRVAHEEVATELAPLLLLLFLVGFLADALWIGRWGRVPPPRFDVDRLGGARSPGRRSKLGGETVLQALLVIAVGGLGTLSACGTSDRVLAHRENELGLVQDALGRWESARIHFERAIAYGQEAGIPTYNLARSVTRSGDHSEAHGLYQRALELDPGMVEAHHGDGVALYRWGREERDPRDCELTRTLELWTAAGRRFATAAKLAPRDSGQRERSRGNHRFLLGAIREVEALIADPPEHCLSDQASPSAASSAESESSTGGAGRGGDPDAGGGAGSGSGDDGSLTPDELDGIRREFDRIAEQAREEGKFHRRTRPEQIHEGDWGNPEKKIWW